MTEVGVIRLSVRAVRCRYWEWKVKSKGFANVKCWVYIVNVRKEEEGRTGVL